MPQPLLSGRFPCFEGEEGGKTEPLLCHDIEYGLHEDWKPKPRSSKADPMSLAMCFLAIGFTRQLIGNMDPLSEIMYIRDPSRPMKVYLEMINVAFSWSILSFLPVSWVATMIGQRNTSSVTLILTIIGFLLSFYATWNTNIIMLGYGLMGIGFSSGACCWYGMYCLYPESMGFVIGLFGGCGDMTLLIMPIVLMAMHSGISFHIITSVIVSILLFLCVYHHFAIPAKGWASLLDHEDREEFEGSEDSGVSVWTDLWEDLKDPRFTSFLVFVIPNVVRIKKHFMPFYRIMFEELKMPQEEGVEDLCSLFAFLTSMGWIASLGAGKMADVLGFQKLFGLILINGLAFMVCVIYGNEFVHRYFNSVFFVCATGTCFGIPFIYISSIVKPSSFGIVQGIVFLIIGLCFAAFDHLWNVEHIFYYFTSMRSASLFLSITSFVVQVAGYIWWIYADLASQKSKHQITSPLRKLVSLVTVDLGTRPSYYAPPTLSKIQDFTRSWSKPNSEESD